MSFESGDFERRLIAELEAQQNHIAQELHDALGSRLSAMVMLLAAMQKMQPQNSLQKKALEQLLLHAQAAVQTTRKLARDLMSADSEPQALWRVLERLCLDYDQIPGLSCQLLMQDKLSWVTPELVNPLYRITQEALTNAFRSGYAQNVVVSFADSEGIGCMTVHDDGVGMPSDSSAPALRHGLGHGLGLRTMRARARAAGAAITFESNSPVGTVVRVTWPTSFFS